MVINCIALESVSEALECLKNLPVSDTEILQMTGKIKRSRGRYHINDGGKSGLYYFPYRKLSVERIGLWGQLVFLTAGASGSGKTLITCGILQALKNRGLLNASFKRK